MANFMCQLGLATVPSYFIIIFFFWPNTNLDIAVKVFFRCNIYISRLWVNQIGFQNVGGVRVFREKNKVPGRRRNSPEQH